MIVFTLIGAFIGAGFASGQEIYLFFYRYGKAGIAGITLCSLILTYVIYKTLKIVYENKIETYKDLLNHIFGEKHKFSNLNNVLVNLFLGMTFFIMVAGFGTYFNQEFGIESFLGSAIFVSIAYLIFLKNVEGITKINSIIVPILTILIFIIGIINIPNIKLNQIGANLENINNGISWAVQAIIYSSYNLILLIPVILNLKKFIKNQKQIKFIAISTGIIIAVMAIFTFLLLTNVKTDFSKLEMPVVYVIKDKFMEFKTIYGIIILSAIFTTAISVGMSFLNNICKDQKNLPQYAVILCAISLIVSKIGFSNLVKILFPLFGYLGLIQFYFIAKSK